MALPLLNDTPKYELTVPSSKQKIKYRPYLVKEEKILFVANESGDRQQVIRAIADTIRACTNDAVNVNQLTTFDLEYIFIKIRAKSVGEKITLYLPCGEEHCKQRNEVEINLDEIDCPILEQEKVIKLNDDISVEMRYPNYNQVDNSDDEQEIAFNIVASCLAAVLTKEERIEIDDEDPSEVKRFLDSLTNEQFKKIGEFVRNLPQIKYDIKFDCTSCGEHNTIEVKGMQNFF